MRRKADLSEKGLALRLTRLKGVSGYTLVANNVGATPITKINKWMEQACSLNNKFINSFIHGITRDITAVKNAIIYDYNNGLAEGSVNKLKVIKRVMYGRNSFDMLYKKFIMA